VTEKQDLKKGSGFGRPREGDRFEKNTEPRKNINFHLNSGLHEYMQIVGTLCAFLFFSGTGV
jgi:hypothetical protein